MQPTSFFKAAAHRDKLKTTPTFPCQPEQRVWVKIDHLLQQIVKLAPERTPFKKESTTTICYKLTDTCGLTLRAGSQKWRVQIARFFTPQQLRGEGSPF